MSGYIRDRCTSLSDFEDSRISPVDLSGNDVLSIRRPIATVIQSQFPSWRLCSGYGVFDPHGKMVLAVAEMAKTASHIVPSANRHYTIGLLCPSTRRAVVVIDSPADVPARRRAYIKSASGRVLAQARQNTGFLRTDMHIFGTDVNLQLTKNDKRIFSSSQTISFPVKDRLTGSAMATITESNGDYLLRYCKDCQSPLARCVILSVVFHMHMAFHELETF